MSAQDEISAVIDTLDDMMTIIKGIMSKLDSAQGDAEQELEDAKQVVHDDASDEGVNAQN